MLSRQVVSVKLCKYASWVNRLCPTILKLVRTLCFTRLNPSDKFVNRMSSPSQIVSAPQPPRLLDQLRNRFRLWHYTVSGSGITPFPALALHRFRLWHYTVSGSGITAYAPSRLMSTG
jgi:hypothetical protein